jgi:hypothetical protein
MVPIMTLDVLDPPNPLMDHPESIKGPSKSSTLFDMQPVHLLSSPIGSELVLNIAMFSYWLDPLACIATTAHTIRDVNWLLAALGLCI